jgi:hypothetical protein
VPPEDGLLLGVPVPVPLEGELMSGVPGDDGTPGVDGLLPAPLLELELELLPGAPVLEEELASTPKCEYTCWLHVVSMVGQLAELNDGALCSFARSTFNVSWSELPLPLCWIRLHGTATRLPLDEDVELELFPLLLPVLALLSLEDDFELLLPIPLVVEELLLPGALLDELSSERTTNWTCPLEGSMTASWMVPRFWPELSFALLFMSFVTRQALPEWADEPVLPYLLELLEGEPLDEGVLDLLLLLSSSFAKA